MQSLYPSVNQVQKPQSYSRRFLRRNPFERCLPSEHPPHAPRRSLVSLCFAVPADPFPPLRQTAHAGAERQLVAAINDYRAHPQRCDRRPAQRLAPLALKSNLALPIGYRYSGGMREALKSVGLFRGGRAQYPHRSVPQDAEEAFDRLQSDYCGALLDATYADIGIRRTRSEWQVVLARPVLDSRVGDNRSVGKALLAEVNAARARPRMCGRQRFAAARPLSWNAALGAAAQGHSKAMAYGNYFAHRDPDGDLPADRAKAAVIGVGRSAKILPPGRVHRARRWPDGWPVPGIAPTS
jgi:hypothetical protein